MSNVYQTIQRTYYHGEEELFKRYSEDLRKIDNSDIGAFEEIQATLESELDATLAEEVASMAARIRELEVIWGTEQTP